MICWHAFIASLLAEYATADGRNARAVLRRAIYRACGLCVR